MYFHMLSMQVDEMIQKYESELLKQKYRFPVGKLMGMAVLAVEWGREVELYVTLNNYMNLFIRGETTLPLHNI